MSAPDASAVEAPARPGPRWRLGVAARQGALAVADQAVVSGGRFVLTVLIGRLAGVESLGLYAMGFAVMMIGVVAQESLLLSPYAVLGNQTTERKRRRALGAAWAAWLGGVLLGVAGLLIIAGVLAAFGSAGVQHWAGLLLVLAVAGPGVMLHGMARGAAYAHLRVASALRLDIAVCAGQVGAVLWIWSAGGLNAETALLGMGAAGAVGAIGWWWLHRGWLGWDRRAVRPWLRRSWRFGRWLLGSQQARTLSGLVVTWVLASVLGEQEAGRYAAAALVVVAANPLILGLGGIMEPKAAAAWSSGGVKEVRRVVRKVTALLAVVLAGYTVLAALLGETVLDWVLADEAYAGLGHAMTVLAAGMLVRGVRIGWNNAIKAAGRPAWNFTAGVAELAVLAALIGPMAWHWGVGGAAYAVFFASVAGSICRAYAYTRIVYAPRQDRLESAPDR